MATELITVHFKMKLDKVLDLLDADFRENMSVYTAFSAFSDDEIIKKCINKSLRKDMIRLHQICSYMLFLESLTQKLW